MWPNLRGKYEKVWPNFDEMEFWLYEMVPKIDVWSQCWVVPGLRLMNSTSYVPINLSDEKEKGE